MLVNISLWVISLDDYRIGSNLFVRKRVSTDILRVLLAEGRCRMYTRGNVVVVHDDIEVEDKPLRFHLHRAAPRLLPSQFQSIFYEEKTFSYPGGVRTEPTKVNANKMDSPRRRIKLVATAILVSPGT